MFYSKSLDVFYRNIKTFLYKRENIEIVAKSTLAMASQSKVSLTKGLLSIIENKHYICSKLKQANKERRAGKSLFLLQNYERENCRSTG